MKVTSKGQVTIPQNVREAMGIMPSETEVEFKQNENGQWYLSKLKQRSSRDSRFRKVHMKANLTMSTEDILALTRG